MIFLALAVILTWETKLLSPKEYPIQTQSTSQIHLMVQ